MRKNRSKKEEISIQRILKEKGGITLIALVITIIVLIILATVTLNVILGEGGLIERAQLAKDMTEQSVKEEQESLNTLIDEMANMMAEDSTIPNPPKSELEEAKESGEKFEDTTTITDDSDNDVKVPGGFHIAEDSATKVEDGGVIEDDEGNQFVWIPVESEEEYKRRYMDEMLGSVTIYTDTGYLPEGIQPAEDASENNEIAEREAVMSAGGFYISRFEAGREYDGKEILVSKKHATLMTTNYAGSNENLKNIAKEFSGDNENIKSALCSGIQWDVTMKFVNGKLDGTGEIFNVEEFNINRHINTWACTGENEADRVCNIYDLEGNGVEYVAEKIYYGEEKYVVRGGVLYSGNPQPASGRSTQFDMGLSNADCTGRFVLYVM